MLPLKRTLTNWNHYVAHMAKYVNHVKAFRELGMQKKVS